MEKIIHRFEEAGLGIAPFTFEYAMMGEWANCEYCNHDIKERCYIKDVNGKVFFVGNECVNHTGDEGLMAEAKVHIRELRKKLRHERQAQQIEDGRMLLYAFPRLVDAIDADTTMWLKRRILTEFIHNRMTWGGNTYKLDIVKKVWAKAETVLTEKEIEWFRQTHVRENLLWKYIEEKRLEKVAQQLELDERKREWDAKRTQIATDNADLINILNGMNQTPFVTSMSQQLKTNEFKRFSPRQREILCDIYAKTFGRANTNEYKKAYDELYWRGADKVAQTS